MFLGEFLHVNQVKMCVSLLHKFKKVDDTGYEAEVINIFIFWFGKKK